MIVLRKYQEKIIDDVRSAMRQGEKAILITSPTGSGKTSLTAFMLKTASSKGMNSWFINHRVELILQSAGTFDRVELPHGIVSAGFPEDPAKPVQICSVQSLARRHGRLAPPKLIVWDECAHIAAASWTKIFAAYKDSFHIGLTATPQRLDGKGLGTYFNKMVLGPPLATLIEQGFLSKYKLFAPSTIDMSGAKTKFGDYVKADLSKAACKPVITGHAINEYKKRLAGKSALIFCVSIEHSKAVAELFRSNGITAEHVDGETPSPTRQNAMDRFRRGELRVISNVELYGEGLDVEGLDSVILLRPTQSLSLYLQQVGRVLRSYPGKEYAIILDHAGNAMRHGLPCENREWSLNGKEKRKGGECPVKTCPECFAVVVVQCVECPECGHEFETEKKSRSIETVEGDLIEISPEILRQQRLQEQWGLKSEEELYRLGVKRGYKYPRQWARHVLQSRAAKKSKP